MQIKLQHIAALLIALNIISPSFAQTTLDTEGLSMGEEVGTPIGALYEKERAGDWGIMCVKTETGNAPCHMGQLLFDQNGNNVAEVNVMPIIGEENLAAVMNIVTPLETLLTDQITVDVDGDNIKRYPYSYCSTAGCLSRIGVSPDDLAFYKKGNIAFVTITPAASPNERVVLQMSLVGFTTGFKTVESGLSK